MGEKNKCGYCKKEILTKNLYCSKICQEELRYEMNFKKVELGELKDTNRETIKKVVLRLKGHKCEMCENTEWQGQKIPLILDHIDGYHDNNKLENLRLVCPNCDAQLPTYKSKNKGKGRKNRTIEFYKAQLENRNGGYNVSG